MSEVTSFHTRSLPVQSRFNGWEQRVRRSLGDIRMTRRSNADFDAWSETISDNDVRVGQIGIGACPLEMTAGRRSDTGGELIQAMFPLSGRIELEQFGRRTVLEPGDWGMLMFGEPFRHVHDTPVEVLVLSSPRRLLLPRVAAERYTAQRFCAERGSASLAKSFLAMLLAQRATLNAITAPELVATAARLVRIATLENSLGRAKSDVRLMLHMRIRDFVDRNLQNPELSIATVADSLNCSKRYIHRVFSASGETIGQYILRARLEQCQRFLQQPAMAHLSVTQIAFWWGFNNLAHFSRVFRRQFGMPPTECRKAVPASTYAAG